MIVLRMNLGQSCFILIIGQVLGYWLLLKMVNDLVYGNKDCQEYYCYDKVCDVEV